MKPNNRLIFTLINASPRKMGINSYQKQILICMLDCWNPKRNGVRVWPGIERLADQLGVERNSVIRNLAELEKLEYFKPIKRRGCKTHYNLNIEMIRHNTESNQAESKRQVKTTSDCESPVKRVTSDSESPLLSTTSDCESPLPVTESHPNDLPMTYPKPKSFVERPTEYQYQLRGIGAIAENALQTIVGGRMDLPDGTEAQYDKPPNQKATGE